MIVIWFGIHAARCLAVRHESAALFHILDNGDGEACARVGTTGRKWFMFFSIGVLAVFGKSIPKRWFEYMQLLACGPCPKILNIYIYINKYLKIHIYIYKYIIHICICIYIYTYTYLFKIHISLSLFIYIYFYIYIYIYIYIFVFIVIPK